MLSTFELSCSRGERRLFQDLAFALGSGEWLQVMGENGSGKTTLLRTLVGLSPPDAGRTTWRGVDIRDDPQGYRAATVYFGHAAALKDELTPLENLRLALAIDGIAVNREALVDALGQVGLQDHEDLPARHLSAGEKRRVLLARLLLRPAELWVLDEPFASLDASAVQLLGRLLQDHLAAGRVAVITSHQPVPLARCAEIAL
jgi:heme exporter protein A